MKKTIFTVLAFITLTLSGCSPTPEELYLQELETKMPKVEAIGTIMEEIGGYMDTENFIEVSKGLAVLKSEIDALIIEPYTGEDADLKAVSSELDNGLDTVSELASTLQPLSDKAATSPNATLTPEDEANQNKVLELITKIETHFEAAGKAYDQFESKSSQ